MMMTNSLIHPGTLPNFSDIHIADVEPALDTLLSEGKALLASTLTQKSVTWDSLVVPLEVHDNRISMMWSPISHLHNTMNTPDLREVYQRCIAKISNYYTEIGQNTALYEAYQQLHDSPAFADLNIAEQRTITNALRDFKLSGVSLPTEKKKRFADIQAKLSELTTQFENHVMDATDHWHFHTEDVSVLAGIPDSTLTAAEAKAKADGKSGWLLGIDFPTYYAVVTYADNRNLREQFYTAYCTRASEQGPDAGKFDNSKIMLDILALRYEKAQLLDMNNYAEVSLATKMVDSPVAAHNFLNDLAKRSKPQAEEELKTLQTFAKIQGFTEDLQAWDLAYYSEKLKQATLGYSEEALREYFPAERALTAMFNVIKRLYGMTVSERQVDTYHPDVQFFDIYDEHDNYRGSFYTDLYARPNKRGGAWMDDCRTRMRHPDGTLQHPVAYLNCNFAPPQGGEPAYIRHDDIVTLFHEFGHALHHMLTQIDTPAVSGINGVEWDAVELPSQFMENFAWQKEVLQEISKHRTNDDTLPNNLFEKLAQSRHFQSGLAMMRQLEFSLFDLELHWHYDSTKPSDIQAVLDTVRAHTSVIKPPTFNRFQNGFSHIFAGGYAAGYYSYKWAEVLSSDAFARFEEDGIFNAETGRNFLACILEKGGSEPAKALFIAFRKRDPLIDALLRHNGIGKT